METRTSGWYWVWRTIVAAAGAGLIYIFVDVATRTTEGTSLGFPFAYNTPAAPCSTPNPFNGCGFSFDVYAAIGDYLVWFALLMICLAVIHRMRAALRPPPTGFPDR